MVPALLSRVPGVPQTWLVYHWGLADHSHGVLIEGARDPRGGSGDCVSLTPSAWVRITYVGRPHTQRQEKGKDT